ncbi:MAG: tetratricopeptide repeat protein, partial [Gemmataceae bacterium]|nr:tetratricopeptide repeat protein [Gemmataceae bacterium]
PVVAGSGHPATTGAAPLTPAQVARIGMQAAEALAHAHVQGILHRDIKPSNLLLDEHGTVWVTDFGLARAEGLDDMTHTGEVVGTLRYLAPERFRGQADGRSDVYSLGLTLYELLTHRPAFDAPNREQLIQQVTRAEPPPPRRLRPGIPRDLETIILKAIAREPAHRYNSAADLAEDLRRFLADRPILARRVRLGERVWRWCRRNPVPAALLTAFLLALLGGLGGVTWMWWLAEERRAEADKERDQARKERIEADQQRDQAKQQRAEALKNFRRAVAAVEKYLTAVGDHPELRKHGLETLRKSLLATALPFYQEFAAERSDDPNLQADLGKAYFRLASITSEIGAKEESIRLYQQAIATLGQVADSHPASADYREALAMSHHNLANLFASTSRPELAEPAYHKALALLEPLARADSSLVYVLAACHSNLGQLYRKIGRDAEAQASLRRALATRERVPPKQAADPEHERLLGSSHLSLGLLHREAGRIGAAESAYREALAIHTRLAQADPADPKGQHNLAYAHHNLALLYASVGRGAEAEAAHKNALAIRERLAGNHPLVSDYQHAQAATHNCLGDLYRATGQVARAESSYEKALTIFEKLARDHPRVGEYRDFLAGAYSNRGTLYRDTRRADQAEADYRKALEIVEQLAREQPAVPRYQQHMAGFHFNLGELFRTTGRAVSAEASYRQSLRLLEPLVRQYPTVPAYRDELARGRHNLGVLWYQIGRRAEAEEAWKQTLQVRKQLVREHPTIALYRQQLSANLSNEAVLHYTAGQPKRAEAIWLEALTIQAKLVQERPDVPADQEHLADTYNNLAVLYRNTARKDQAEETYRKALAINEGLVKGQVRLSEAAVRLAGNCSDLGDLTRDRGKLAEALDWYARAVRTLEPIVKKEPGGAAARTTLRNARWGQAETLSRLGRHQEALPEWNRALVLDTGDRQGMLRLGRFVTLAHLGAHEPAAQEGQVLGTVKGLPGFALYDLARGYAVCAAAVRRDDKLPAGERDRLAERHGARALELLTQTDEAGLFATPAERKRLLGHPDFEAIRARPDFGKLLLPDRRRTGPKAESRNKPE